MNQWREFAAARPGERREDEFISVADEIGLILITGEDATDFLHNLLSNDVRPLDEEHHQLSSYSTPKGRMLGIFRVVRITNGYLLVTPRPTVLPLLESLARYVLQSRVNLADASDYFARFTLVTAQAEILAHPALPPLPGSALQNDKIVALQLEPLGEQRRFLLCALDPEAAIELWQSWQDRLQVADYASWRLSEIRAGIPSIQPATSDEFVLQMANLGALDGVSFKKGCFPGQEIVARMQYLGKLKRRMFLARIDTGQLPQPGDELVARGKDRADGSGKIVDAEFDTKGQCHCLYIARIDRAEAGELALLEQPDASIENSALPYPLAS